MGKKKAQLVDLKSGTARELQYWVSVDDETRTAKLIDVDGDYIIPGAGQVVHDPSGRMMKTSRWSWEQPMFWMLLGVFIMNFLELLARTLS